MRNQMDTCSAVRVCQVGMTVAAGAPVPTPRDAQHQHIVHSCRGLKSRQSAFAVDHRSGWRPTAVRKRCSADGPVEESR